MSCNIIIAMVVIYMTTCHLVSRESYYVAQLTLMCYFLDTDMTELSVLPWKNIIANEMTST